MADINIERKRTGGLGWLWALLAIALLALLLWWFLMRNDDPSMVGRADPTAMQPIPGAAPDPGTTGTAGMPPEVQQYIQWAENTRAQQDAGQQHEWSATGIRSLTDALEAMVRRDTVNGAALQPQLQQLRQHAQAVQQNPGSVEHANHVREAARSAAQLMSGLQERRFPNQQSQVAEVRSAADGIRPGQNLLDQREQVSQFFTRAASALRAMSTGG